MLSGSHFAFQFFPKVFVEFRSRLVQARRYVSLDLTLCARELSCMNRTELHSTVNNCQRRLQSFTLDFMNTFLRSRHLQPFGQIVFVFIYTSFNCGVNSVSSVCGTVRSGRDGLHMENRDGVSGWGHRQWSHTAHHHLQLHKPQPQNEKSQSSNFPIISQIHIFAMSSHSDKSVTFSRRILFHYTRSLLLTAIRDWRYVC